MAGIFAGIDASGRMRFVADVPRGLACGCFCPNCRAALVAKQGDEKDWHFAHEQSQERPECRVGALNLLRRLIAEEFIAAGRFTPPPFAAAHPAPMQAPITWNERAIAPVRALPFQSQDSPLAEVDLERSGIAKVYVAIGKERPPAVEKDHPAALVWCPEPALGQLRSETAARSFVREHMDLRWLWLPDTQGLVAAAKQKFDAEMLDRIRLLRTTSSRDAGVRWAAVRRGFQFGQQGPVPAAEPPPPPVVRRAGAPVWAPGWKIGTSFHYRRLDDDTQWVLYQVGDGGWRLTPVPGPFDGWDEVFQPSIARPGDGDWLEVASFDRLLGLLHPHTKGSRIDSDPSAIEAEFNHWSTPDPHASPDV